MIEEPTITLTFQDVKMLLPHVSAWVGFFLVNKVMGSLKVESMEISKALDLLEAAVKAAQKNDNIPANDPA